jgi:hypothetical protein
VTGKKRSLLLLSLLALGGAAGGCRRAGHAAAVPEPAPVSAIAPLPPAVQRGVSFVHSWQDGGTRGYGSPTSRASLQELRALGADWISVMPFGFVSALDAEQVQFAGDQEAGPSSHRPQAGETNARVRRQIADAHEQGLKVLLKPHLWVGRGDWCGEINPSTPERAARFFASYQSFALHYARLAQSGGADLLAIGVELCALTAHDPERWRKLIEQVRQVYAGPLVYAANWDEVARVPFWDALDYIGVQFYAPLTDDLEAADEAMGERLSRELDRLGELAQRAHKQVLFTEVGYKSIRGTAVRPHLWPEQLRGSAVEVSLPAQAQAYRVFFAGVRSRPWLAGVYIWKWFSDPTTTEEDAGGFSPRGKPAEAVLRAAYRPADPLPAVKRAADEGRASPAH